MLFTNPRQIAHPYMENRNGHQELNHYFPILIKRNNIQRMDATGNIKDLRKTEVTVQKETEVKKMKWGEPTWFLFHTLAEKVKEEEFQKLKPGLLRMVYLICTNLPCPTCSEHAKSYLDKINFDAIQTKEQFKDMFFVFHNFVNKVKKFPIFEWTELNEKYSKANTLNIIKNFIFHFKDVHSASINVIANDFHRTNVVNEFTGWLNNNISSFQL